MTEIKPKSFWRKPEGVTGALVLAGLLIGGGYLVATSLVAITAFLATTAGLVVGLLTLGIIIFMAIDPKTRALVNYMYKSAMRWITGLFVQINPIAILKSYVEDLKENLRKMNRQISTTAPENGEHAGSAFAFFFAPRWPFAATAWLDNTCPLTLEKSEAIPN